MNWIQDMNKCTGPGQLDHASVADLPDDELLRRVVRSVVRKRRPKSLVAWAPVSEAFSLGSTYAAQLCRRFGLDPDTGAEIKTPNV
jgi:hypothetical protein